MSLLSRWALRFRPPRIQDPVFGPLLFMYIPSHPARSYWEGEWIFPQTGSRVAIALPGDSAGPSAAAREFYLGLPDRFDSILERARPRLEQVFAQWLQRPLSPELWDHVALAGFGVEYPGREPLEWDIAFETTGETWLGITIPFVGDVAQPAVVDT